MKIILFFLGLMMASEVGAHTRWQLNGTLPPRTDSSGIKASDAPCGNRKFTTRTPVQSGQTLTIQWEETIDHPGHFEVWFSEANDQNWVLLKTIPDDQSGRSNTPHFFVNTIEVPQVTCDNCTFQLRQIMTDRSPPTLYYSCADVNIAPTNPVLVNPPPTPPPTSPPPMKKPEST